MDMVDHFFDVILPGYDLYFATVDHFFPCKRLLE